MEQVKGIEPSSSVWKTEVLAFTPHLHKYDMSYLIKRTAHEGQWRNRTTIYYVGPCERNRTVGQSTLDTNAVLHELRKDI